MEKIKIDQNIDMRGVSCPLNYVKTKLAIEELEVGEVLAVLLDDGEPIVNVPRSAKEDGHQILEVNKIQDHYQVLIKKR
ncbi:MAG: sulfurtransferase TusA family protein [Candidatus Saganbacteria bacterium]|nr:sulfurtransferase TusA family protein [Candidatus Saganbacteria bacterium]